MCMEHSIVRQQRVLQRERQLAVGRGKPLGTAHGFSHGGRKLLCRLLSFQTKARAERARGDILTSQYSRPP